MESSDDNLSQLEALRRRIEELERENKHLLSRMSTCRRCSKKMKVEGNTACKLSEDVGLTGELTVPVEEESDRLDEVDVNSADRDDSCLTHPPIRCSEGEPRSKMRYVALKIMYFGQRFYGFASQTHMEPTVESEVFKALERTKLVGKGEKLKYSRCGRTDKGVSSTGQVISLYLRSRGTSSEGNYEDEIDYVKVLNRALPQDIRVMGWCSVPSHFSSRFSCLSREYKYFFWREDLDIEVMQDAANRFVGEHDFRNFCKMDAANVSNFRRRITSITISPSDLKYDDDELFEVTIHGTAFLWHQVRCIVSVLFMVGRGHESPTIVDVLLDTSKTPRKPQYAIAPEIPLVLRSCEFEDVNFSCSPDAYKALVNDLNMAIKMYHMQAAIVSEALGCCFSVSTNGNLTDNSQKKPKSHVPLLKRPTEPTYEERMARLVGRKKE